MTSSKNSKEQQKGGGKKLENKKSMGQDWQERATLDAL